MLGIVLAQQAGIPLPEKPPCPGWQASEQRIVTPENIFDYMNGAGELYRSYSFRRLDVREYTKVGEPAIVCEAYTLPSSADAFGLFSQDRTGEKLSIGQEALYASGLLLARQGNCFIRILAERETPDSRRCAVALAEEIVKKCGPAGKLPDALRWLPAKGLAKDSLRYFHTNDCLNYYYFLSNDNILNLSTGTEAVLGSYGSGGGKSLAVVVVYPTVAQCRAAWSKFRKAYLDGLKPEGDYSLAQLENGKWVGGRTKGNRLMLVLESPTRKGCADLAEAIYDIPDGGTKQ